MHPTSAAGAINQLDLRHVVVAVDLPCRGCAYDIKGLGGDGKCPECGLPVVETIRSAVDPAGTRLPKLQHPVLVGNGLLWLMLCVVTAAAALTTHPALAAIGSTGPWGIGRGPGLLPLLAAAATLAGLWSVYAMCPPRGREPDTAVWRDVWFIAAGLLGWSVLSVGLWLRGRAIGPGGGAGLAAGADPLTIGLWLGVMLAAILVLLGVGGVVGTIGRRSLAYRRSHSTRQGVNAMVMALVGAGLGIALKGAAEIWPARNWEFQTDRGPVFMMNIVGTVGAIVAGVCLVMAFIGLLYMLVNAVWIRASLRQPPPLLDQIVLPALPPDTHVPGAEDDEDELA